jgi:capsular polysaccharide transport system permease protein
MVEAVYAERIGAMNDIDEPYETTVEEKREGVRRRSALPALPAVRFVSGVQALRAFAGRALQRRSHDVDETADPGLGRRRRLAASPILLSFIACVLMPASAGFVYFFVIATDQYTAETRFAVRAADDTSDQKPRGGSLLSPLLSSATSFAQQDAEIVSSYIRSRAIIDDLEGIIDLRTIFRRPEADFLTRLPDDASAEVLRDYWLRMVSTYLENVSGIVNVKVRAFRRDDALALAKAILVVSERLVNSISLRARADAMRRAEEEVRRADGSMRLALDDLARFRDSEGIIDPVKSADLAGQILLQLMQDKIKIETELFIAQRVSSAEGPGVASLRARLESVEAQIASMRVELAGKGEGARSLAAALGKYEELEVKREFAESVYGFAREGLERARITAEKQTIYVTVFVPPALPEEVSYPLRLSFSALIAISLAVAWGTGAMICASVMDHRL